MQASIIYILEENVKLFVKWICQPCVIFSCHQSINLQQLIIFFVGEFFFVWVKFYDFVQKQKEIIIYCYWIIIILLRAENILFSCFFGEVKVIILFCIYILEKKNFTILHQFLSEIQFFGVTNWSFFLYK